MRKFAVILFLMYLAVVPAFSYQAKEVSVMTQQDLANLLKGKLVSMQISSVSEDHGNLFIIARDEKTRKLEWFLINPASKHIIRNGKCPFVAFFKAEISPDSQKALVYARYPMSIWYLDLSTKKWKQVFKNKKEGGISLATISPLGFVDSLWAWSIFDEKDKRGIILRSYAVNFIPDPFTLVKLISLQDLTKKSVQKAYKRHRPFGWKFMADMLIFGKNRQFVYVLKSRSKRENKFADFLMYFKYPDTMKVLYYEKERIIPLDFQVNPFSVLFTTVENKKNVVKLYYKGNTTTLIQGKAMAGAFMKGGLVGLSIISGKSQKIFVGKIGGKLKEVLTLTKPAKVGFTRDGTRIILMDNNSIKCYRIIKN